MQASEKISRPDGDISYSIHGDSGPYVVLVCTLSTDWVYQVKYLSGKYRVVVFDLRGFGQSSSIEGYPDCSEHADDLKYLIDFLGINYPVLVGLSYGGVVLQNFLKKYEEYAKGYVFIASPSKLVGSTRKRMSMLLDSLKSNDFEAFWQASSNLLMSQTNDVSFKKKERALKRTIYNNLSVNGLANIYSNVFNHDSSGWFELVKTPCMVIHGKDDLLFEFDSVKSLSDELGGCQMEMLEASHLIQIEKYEQVNNLLSLFIDGLQAC